MTCDDFERQVFVAAERSAICDEATITESAEETVKIRIYLFSVGFIEAYFNQVTGTTAYALIVDGKRVFGADNTRGWHYHPFDDPGRHEPLTAAMTFNEFLSAVEQGL